LSCLSTVTPQTDYYIVAGYVYQAPDMCTVLNSRLVSICIVNHPLASTLDIISARTISASFNDEH